MSRRQPKGSRIWGLLSAVCALAAWCAPAGAAEGPGNQSQLARQILHETGIQGGLIVHLGCGDGRLTAALRADNRYLVHGLETDPAKVDQARRQIQSLGLYGPVSVDLYDGRHLPYAENLVNLVVAERMEQVPQEELMRVLAPQGVAYVKTAGGWRKLLKPRPDQIDDWTHFLGHEDGNAVAHDLKVGPPKRLQWLAGPRWCRSHEIPTSIGAVVSTGGRIFTIHDEGPIGVYRKLPQKWRLVARDAQNGLLLWKVALRNWQPEFGTGTAGRWQAHHTMPRRLVAQGDKVFVTLTFRNAPVSVLDAATGRVLVEALPGTQGTDEMICDGKVLVAKISPQWPAPNEALRPGAGKNDGLVGVDVESNRLLWRKDNLRVAPFALAMADGRVVYHNLEELVCLDAATGKELWRTPNDASGVFAGGSTLVVTQGVVLYHGYGALRSSSGAARRGRGPAARLTALALEDGRELWSAPGRRGFAAASTQPADLFVANGLVWLGPVPEGRDLQTGEVKKSVDIGQLISPGHHPRCYRSKATERYLIYPKRGAEFVDLVDGNHMRNDWVRGACLTGVLPANGLLYVPPDQCFCYPGVKLPGYKALSADPVELPERPKAVRLQRGPAFARQADVSGAESPTAGPDDWPMYRHDPLRSGSTRTRVPVELGKLWEVRLSAAGAQPIVVAGRVFVVEKDAHRLRCFDAETGRALWSFTAGGRIDSAPSWYQGRLYFGCTDGWVYCVEASTGDLVWRFHAAPDERRIVAFEQLESVWPVHGSVLVQDGVVYFAAGRSSYLDGGILVYGLDAESGRLRCGNHVKGPWPDVATDTGAPFAMEGALSDLFVSDGRDLYMRRIKFDTELNRIERPWLSPLGEIDMGADHLVATGGFLDDSGFDRLYWMYSPMWPGFYFAQHAPKSGQLLVFDHQTTYAVKYFYRRVIWSPAFFPAEDGYLLYADANDNQPVLAERGQPPEPFKWLPEESYHDSYRRGGRGVEKGSGYQRIRPAKWQQMIPLRVRAMVLADEKLFLVGPPDVLPEDDPLAPFEGRVPAQLWVVSAAEGKKLAQYLLGPQPVFDGLSAAGGRLYLATSDGRLICLGAGKGVLSAAE